VLNENYFTVWLNVVKCIRIDRSALKNIDVRGTNMRFDNLHPADQLAATMNRIYTGGLTTASAGNLSPDDVDKGTLTSQDMIRVSSDKTITGHWRPSSGLSFHEAIYNAKPQIQAILHAHSPSLTIFSMIHELPVLNIIPNSALQCCPIIMIPYGSGDNTERQRLLADLFHRDYRAVLIENHGVYVAAESLTKAYRIFETLEHAASVELMARRVGAPSILTDEEVNVARTIAHTRLSDFQPRSQSSEEKALRRDLVRIIKRAVEQGIFGATHGTLSSKLSDGSDHTLWLGSLRNCRG
jgi:L-fuculose-phosphate aldolase